MIEKNIINSRKMILSPVYTFVLLKAFGDLVIAINCLTRIMKSTNAAPSKLLIGYHYRHLCDALSPQIDVEILSNCENSVPSLYDVRKNGLISATQSYCQLRRAFTARQRAENEIFIFDRWGIREKLLSANIPATALPRNKSNIYLAYAAFWGLSELPPPVVSGGNRNRISRLGIFPGARMSKRVIPINRIEEIAACASTIGVDVEVVLIEKELPEYIHRFSDAKILPRSFNNLIACMTQFDGVVSADSFTAHLAEYLNIPVFVFSPIENQYWLPYSSFQKGNWALFEDPSKMRNLSLINFLLP